MEKNSEVFKKIINWLPCLKRTSDPYIENEVEPMLFEALYDLFNDTGLYVLSIAGSPYAIYGGEALAREASNKIDESVRETATVEYISAKHVHFVE